MSALVEFAAVRKSFGDKTVLPGLDLRIGEGEFLTLLGPSGCGKTTALRLLAGFETPDGGEIRLDGICINELPPERRPINTVFQSYALFPHLTVAENVGFGPRMRGARKAEVERSVGEALELVRLSDLAGRKPAQLSGGQQQRVALARALVNRPRVLLLDEPLSALDYRLRKAMQGELKALQRQLGLTFLFVTHDQEEALSMSDRIAVLREGVIQQLGAPREIYENPANRFVAQFVGDSNLLEGAVIRRVDADRAEIRIENRTFALRAGPAIRPGAAVHIVLRPEDLRVESLPEGADAGSRLRGVIQDKIYKGVTLDTLIRLDSGALIRASEFFDADDPSFDYELGERVAVGWVADWETVLPDSGEP
jgi:spermidine/putrescine transport system ATP-binding protein